MDGRLLCAPASCVLLCVAPVSAQFSVSLNVERESRGRLDFGGLDSKQEARYGRFAERLFPLVRPGVERRGAASGGGAGVPGISSVETTQVLYDTPEVGLPSEGGNWVLVTWDEGTPQDEVTVTIEGTVADFDPVAVSCGPGCLLVGGFPRCDLSSEDCSPSDFAECPVDGEKFNVYKITVTGSDGTSDTVCQEILYSWPLANEMSICCRADSEAQGHCEGEATSEADIFQDAESAGLECARDAVEVIGACGIVVTGGNSGPTATRIVVFLDDAPVLTLEPRDDGEPVEIKCFEQWLPVDSAGDHLITVVGFLDRERAETTSWKEFQDLVGSFVGIDPNAILGLDPALACEAETTCQTVEFDRGDANADGHLDLSDGVNILGFLFLGTEAPECLDGADADDSGVVNIADAVSVFSFLFQGGNPPPEPFGRCGDDTTPDSLSCVRALCQ